IETSRTLGGGSRRIILWTVILPASLPGIVDTCRQMLAVSWTYLVIAEIVAATDGIGAMIMRARRFVHVDDIMAGILVIGLRPAVPRPALAAVSVPAAHAPLTRQPCTPTRSHCHANNRKSHPART